MTLFWLGAAWLVGLVLGREVAWAIWLWLALGGAALAGTLIARRIAALRLCFVTLMLLCLGAARLRLAQPVFDPEHIALRNDTPYALTITGIVVAPPDVRDQYTALRLSVETVRSGAEDEEPAHGLVLIFAPRFLDWSYGDRVSASGTLQTPPSLDDFSYREYLARQGIHSLMPDAYVRRLATRQANPLLYALYTFRTNALHTLHKVLPDPEASLLSGILLGVESGIQPDVRKAFNDTGTSHIIAISG